MSRNFNIPTQGEFGFSRGVDLLLAAIRNAFSPTIAGFWSLYWKRHRKHLIKD